MLSSGCLQDYKVAFKLFSRIASILEGLHQIGHFIPHLILDDIMVIKGEQDELKVKIDYKLSRFLVPKMDRPSPILKRLLTCHPDIINHRPLDFRSDIWSLGKIFVEILDVDFESIDFLPKIDKMPLPQEVAVLLKIMLAEDPDLRPRSMGEVARILSRVNDEEIEAVRQNRIESGLAPVKQIKGLKKRMTILVIIVAVLGFLIGVLAWYYFRLKEADGEAVLLHYANQYAGSVAFVMVDYRLFDGDTVAYHNRTEGTAFLVDGDGYLLTSRHVVCPWLEDSDLYMIINMLRQNQRTPRLEYRMFLWFEGVRAFNRLPGFSGSIDLEDIYFTDLSFSSDGTQRLMIAGVAKSPTKTWQLVKSPLKDDFAVLKIDQIPAGLKPLPLDLHMDPLKIARLSPVIALGFPLGSQTQAATVNVSVTQGHVRRTFENMIQVDSSIHSGNSGGPIIDHRGKVIGIALGVAVGRAIGPIPVTTPLSDIGMILPITKAVHFIGELKAGQTKWNGVLDLSIDAKLKRITDAARQGKWTEAKAIADKELQHSLDPALVMADGMLHFCDGDSHGAVKLFSQAVSMDEENDKAKLMLFIIDWLAGTSHKNIYRRQLMALDWRSQSEFVGYLVKILEGEVDEESALSGGYTESEKSWLHYITGLIRAKQGVLGDSETLLKKAVLLADVDDWLFFLSLAELKKIQHQRLNILVEGFDKIRYAHDIETFAGTIEKNHAIKSKKRTKLTSLFVQLKQEHLGSEDKQRVLEQILENERNNGDTLTELVFYSAMNDKWKEALEYARMFLEIKGRENAGRLSVGLLEAGIFHRMEQEEEAKAILDAYHHRTRDPWYRGVSEVLSRKEPEQSLSEKAEENPENLLTWHTALGFWAEGSRDKQKAIRHYKEALGSYMDTRIEYDFAKERINRLRRASE
ncbi:MAG: hypothetical protein A2V65_03550 [Deltaproteobacteria bacterium RBG_13_49_15]|nr:MAG: hypothetical protein A2V65_03550 [Deltaproteobacteria bacterium RBG_13_49_15]